MVDTQSQTTEDFKHMYNVVPTSKDAQEVVRQALVKAYDAYKEHQARVSMQESHPWYKHPRPRWFPGWPWDAVEMNIQKFNQIKQLVAAARPFFPDMGLEFFVKEADNSGHWAKSDQLLRREGLTSQQKYLLSGK